jgi:hypothetical protein
MVSLSIGQGSSIQGKDHKSLQGNNFPGFVRQEYVTGKCPASPAL